MTPTPTQKAPHRERPHQESASRNQRATPRITCGGCDTTWTGVHRAHCSACHRTFNSPTGFDRHRRGGHCADPAELGLTRNDEGIWRHLDPDFDPAEAFHGGRQ